MTLNPVESLNTFSETLKNNLRQRSFSQELVRTRAPFLRFTTGANMSELQDKLGSEFRVYNGYQFFSLGLHGWENLSYRDEDIYGTRGNNGLVVGVTYKDGEQKLVYTQGTRIREVGVDGTATTTRSGARNYPPPGITNAKIERLRNGNVLRATVDIVVYTQEQLELLDAVCFVPGMNCILEWGSMQTTPAGPLFFGRQGLQTLDFTRPNEIYSHVQNAVDKSREQFIQTWCEPNGFNYDWTVARIANVRTKLQDNAYKVSVIMYSRADNLMYISAYATTTTLTPALAQEYDGSASSINYYFRLNGEFSSWLKSAVRDTSSGFVGKVISLTAPMDQSQLQQIVPAPQTYGVGNELGFEDTFFISFDTFVNNILNGDVLRIINRGLPSKDKLKNVLAPLNIDTDAILVGYNEHLRSADPSILLVYNKKAQEATKTNTSALSNSVILSSQQRLESTAKRVVEQTQQAADQINGALDAKSVLTSNVAAGRASIIPTLENNEFGRGITSVSDSTTITSGIYINSKAIQAAFMQARTIYEGLGTLLQNINAAVENYWDLKLYYDDDLQAFRILDDNLRLTRDLSDPNNLIYEFNKGLAEVNDSLLGKTTIGPDVLDIEINTDYPKLVFSKLAVSAINDGTISSEPIRTDIDFSLGARVGDLFKPTTEAATEGTGQASPRQPEVRFTDIAAVIAAFKNNPTTKTIDGRITSANFSLKISNELNAAFPGQNITPELATWIGDLLSNPLPLTVAEAKQFKASLDDLKARGIIPTTQAYVALLNVAKLRIEGIIKASKDNERGALNSTICCGETSLFNFAKGGGVPIAADDPNATSKLAPNQALLRLTDDRGFDFVKVAQEQGFSGLSTAITADVQRLRTVERLPLIAEEIKAKITQSEEKLLARISSIVIAGSNVEAQAQQDATKRLQDQEAARAEYERTPVNLRVQPITAPKPVPLEG